MNKYELNKIVDAVKVKQASAKDAVEYPNRTPKQILLIEYSEELQKQAEELSWASNHLDFGDYSGYSSPGLKTMGANIRKATYLLQANDHFDCFNDNKAQVRAKRDFICEQIGHVEAADMDEYQLRAAQLMDFETSLLVYHCALVVQHGLISAKVMKERADVKKTHYHTDSEGYSVVEEGENA